MMIDDLRQYLKKISIEIYFNEDIPSSADEAIFNFINLLYSQREKALEQLTSDEVAKLRIFVQRMASFSVRKNSINHIVSALYALALCFKEEDERDVLVSISMLYHSILKLHQDPRRIFENIGYLDAIFLSFLKAFINRNEEDKSTESFGLTETETKEGFLWKKRY